MNFAVDVTDAALDTLPQDLSYAAFGRLIDTLEELLSSNPVAASRKIEHPDNSFTNGCRGGFQEDGHIYLFTAFFYYSLDERVVHV
jgi:hypothetical protein